ncbi:carbohydrate binding domain-containing protein [Kribbella sp. CWNU-51]
MRARWLAVVVGVLLAGITVPAQAANILTNPGFETGSLSGWTCSGGSVVTTRVRTGGYALNGAVTSSDFAQCSQTVAVQPSTSYTLSAWVRGSYVYLGVTGGSSTWTPSAANFTQLSLSFTTGASQTSAEIYVHGWYGQPAYQADDLSLDGPGGTPGAPSVPGTPTVTSTTSSAISLGWPASTGTVTGYRVYEGASVVQTVSGTTATVSGLAACSSHTYSVAAYNSVGESAKSAATSGTTGGCTSTGLPKHALIGYLHASFANGSGYVRMADVPAEWNIINLSFGEPTSVTSGDIRFNRCSVSECPNVESDADFVAAIRAKQAAGKKVLISIGGANGQVQLTTTAARDAFISSVSAIIDRYGHGQGRVPGGEHRSDLPWTAGGPDRVRAAGGGQRRERLHRPGSRSPSARLPGQGPELWWVQPPWWRFAGVPRADDVVDQLGPLLQLGVPEQPRAVPRGPALRVGSSGATEPARPARSAPSPRGPGQSLWITDPGLWLRAGMKEA